MTRPRVVFVRPPNLQMSEQWKRQGVKRCPLNIALLASYIRRNGNYDCSLADFEVEPVVSLARMAETILKEAPRYVCFTTLTPRFPTVVRLARELKSRDPDVVTIAGGPHVTGSPAACMHDGISYGIIGEGEEALLELLNALDRKRPLSSIGNLVFRGGGVVRVNDARPFIKNLDAMPMPAWDLMKIEEYRDPAYFEGSHLAMYTSRGCPHDCSFCASAVTWKRRLRFRSLENVLAEIRYIVENLNTRNLMFWDDDFAADKNRCIDLCGRISQEGPGMAYTVQLRADSVDAKLVKALKGSGCKYAALGVESGSDEMLARIGKQETKAQFRKAVKIMKDAGLASIASYIIGLPGDTHETIKETIEFAFELNADQSKFMILAPFPGTRIYESALEKGLVDPLSFEQMEATNYYDSVSINLSDVSSEDLLRYQDEAYERFDKARSCQAVKP